MDAQLGYTVYYTQTARSPVTTEVHLETKPACQILALQFFDAARRGHHQRYLCYAVHCTGAAV